MRLFVALSIASLAIGSLFPAAAAAQFRSRGGSDGRSFDPSEMLRGMDTNRNGQIEPAELASNRMAFFVRGAAGRAGLDLTKPVPIDKLTEAMRRSREERSRDGERRDGDRRRDDDNNRRDGERRDGNSAPAPMGFGGGPGVVGFGAPAAGASAVTGFGSSNLEQRFGSRVITYVDDMLERYDKNKDTYVDSEEWKSGRWSTPPEESDLNKDNRLSKEELCVRIAKRFGTYNEGSSSSSASGSSASNNSDQVRRYAESLLRQYDRNSDGKLEREEWSEMPSQHHSADSNSDGTITTDELSVKLASYATGGSGATAGSTFGSSLGGGSAPTSGIRRFRTPSERLPAGLPAWFLEKDANEDGQVMMSEYASSWSEASAAEFTRHDLNGDGIITAKECLKAESNR